MISLLDNLGNQLHIMQQQIVNLETKRLIIWSRVCGMPASHGTSTAGSREIYFLQTHLIEVAIIMYDVTRIATSSPTNHVTHVIRENARKRPPV